MLDALAGAGDPHQAQHAALAAHRRQHDAWAVVLGGVVAAAARAAGQHIVSLAQGAGVTGASDTYDPDSDDPDSPDAWATQQQDALATNVQEHTGRMLRDALAGPLLLGAGGDAMTATTTALYDQWTGQTGNGDYAGQLAGDLTVLGWGMGECWGVGQMIANGQWSAEKTWNTMGDQRVRATHADADGQTVAADESFTVGDEQLDYPGDPAGSDAETAGCRCWLTWTLINAVTSETQDTTFAED